MRIIGTEDKTLAVFLIAKTSRINREVATSGSYVALILLSSETEYMPHHDGCQIVTW
jgi:hypothetical protein